MFDSLVQLRLISELTGTANNYLHVEYVRHAMVTDKINVTYKVAKGEGVPCGTIKIENGILVSGVVSFTEPPVLTWHRCRDMNRPSFLGPPPGPYLFINIDFFTS